MALAVLFLFLFYDSQSLLARDDSWKRYPLTAYTTSNYYKCESFIMRYYREASSQVYFSHRRRPRSDDRFLLPSPVFGGVRPSVRLWLVRSIVFALDICTKGS